MAEPPRVIQWWVMPQGQGNSKHDEKPVAPPDKPAWRSLPPMRYPNTYVWIVYFSFMDVLLTWLILLLGKEEGAAEINPIAWFIIEGWGDLEGFGMAGASGLKFTLVVLAIVICEIVGRSSDRKGRYLARTLACIAAVPVVWSLWLLLMNQAMLSGVE